MTLRSHVLHGVSWTLACRVGSQAFQFAFSIVLARLLSPAEFGVIGMLLVFTGFAQALADCGLSSALIHKQGLSERHRSTVFWLQLLVGFLLAAIFFACAPAVAAFYSIPVLEPLTRLISASFLV